MRLFELERWLRGHGLVFHHSRGDHRHYVARDGDCRRHLVVALARGARLRPGAVRLIRRELAQFATGEQ